MRDITTIYRLLLRLILGRARLIGLGAMGALGMLIGLVLRLSDVSQADRVDGITRFLIGGFGMNLVVPVTSLVFASAVLGDPAEDKTLVHVWLTPIPRWKVTLSGLLAAVSVAGPLAVAPVTIGVALAGGSAQLVGATALGASAAATCFCAIFLGLGLVVRRAFAWGGAYLFIWELAVAPQATGAARLSVTVHARSLIGHLGDVAVPTHDSTSTLAGIMLAVFVLAGLAFTTWSLQRVDVA